MTRKFSGEIIWKSYSEYNPNGILHGKPYYYITEIDKDYYLWKYDNKNEEYIYLKTSKEFNSLHEEALILDDKEIKIFEKN